MSPRAQLAALVGVFLGGALPMLEAVIVIPGAIVARVNPLAAFTAGVAGNLLTVALAAWGGDRLRVWWRARRGRSDDGAPGADADGPPGRARRVLDRWGLLGLAVLGPLGLGTQASVLVALGIGTPAHRAFTWVAAGTVGWAAISAIAAAAGAGALFA